MHHTTALLGVPLVMETDVIYCTPTRGASAYVQPQDAGLEVSMTPEDADFVSIAPFEGVLYPVAPFIRCTDEEGCTIIFKAS